MAGIYYNAILAFNPETASYTLALADQQQDTVVEMNVEFLWVKDLDLIPYNPKPTPPIN
jgi:hypothetical protein